MKSKILQSTTKVWWNTSTFGFSLVEIILSLAVLALLTTALIGNFIYSQESVMVAGSRARATMLADEGLAAVRNIRDASFANLVDGNYGLATSSNQWVFSGSQDVTEYFTRQIQISTPSANRKQVVSQVTWPQNLQRTGTVTLTTYLTNWMATAGIGNWAAPLQQAIYNASGNQDGFKVQVQGNYVYLVRLDGTPDFLIIDISNLAAPTLTGSLSLSGIPQDLTISGDYAYVASRLDNQELQVIDISNKAVPAVVGTFDAGGANDAVSLQISGSTLYMSRTFDAGNPEIVLVNVTNPVLPTQIGTLNLPNTASDIALVGSYLYVSNYNTSAEFYIVDVSIPTTPSIASSLDLTGNSTGLSVVSDGTYAYVGRTGGEVRAIDVSDPNSPLAMGTFAAGSNVRDLSLGNSNNYLFLVDSGASDGFHVLNVTNRNSLTQVGVFNLPGGSAANGVFYDATLDRAFIASAGNSNELVILQPS